MYTTRRPLVRLDALDRESRSRVLFAAAHPDEPRIYRGVARGLSVPMAELAEEVGVPLWMLERILNGRRPGDPELFARIRTVLGIHEDDLRAARSVSGERGGG
jgi:hypothetical protein